MSARIELIVGLGNPGAQYAKTRHNVGAWFVEQLAEKEGAALRNEPKFHGLIARIYSDGSPCWLLEPTTFMNESGQSVAACARFYKIPIESILVIHDELDFPAGTIRIKEGGGHGGHNGLRNITQHLQSKNFYRLRIGIGHPGHKDRVTPYVLSDPSKTDRGLILETIQEGIAVIPDLIAGEMQRAFRYLHSES